LEWAFQPFKWLWDKLQSLGLVMPTSGPGTGRGGEASLEGYERERGRASGQRGAVGGGVRGPGTPGAPYAAGEITNAIGTDQAHYEAFRETVAGFESGGKYGMMGGSGGHFAGRYQLGAIGHPELADTAKSLGVPTPTIAEFLANPGMQERFFERFTLNHHKWLMANSPEYRALSADEKLAALGYAHNQGAGGLAKYLRTHQAGHDAWGTGGDVYERAIRRAINKIGSASSGPSGQSDPHKPGFDPKSVGFHDYHPELHSSLSPLGHRQFASNAHHDHRQVHSNIDIHVAGAFPVDKTGRPLERTKNASLIRNTTATAS
jgi:hypothetical protein